jgi:hypothetical protein
MSAAPTYPGVYIVEPPSPVHTIVGVATSIAAFVGYTSQGIDNRPQQIFSFPDYERLYGGIASDSELSYAVQQFFSNGGTQAFIARVPREGAGAATVAFNDSQFTWEFSALSSGSWADSNLIIDVDFVGLTHLIPGTLAVTGADVTGTNTSFTALRPNQWLIFAGDPSQTPYQIKSIQNDISLTLAMNIAAALNSTTALFTNDPRAFNLTITNLLDGTVESFPSVSTDPNSNNYIINTVNDPDTGSQLVSVKTIAPPLTPASTSIAPAATGLIGAAKSVASILSTLCGTSPVTGNIAITQGSTTVTGNGSKFPDELKSGQFVIFASDPNNLYSIAAVKDASTLTLTTPFNGASAATTTALAINLQIQKDYSIALNVSSPSPAPPPLPLAIKVFTANTAPPQTLAGIASQVQSAINAQLSVKIPGASVQLSVANWLPVPAIRVTGMLPQYPDVVFAFTAPGGSLNDAAPVLGLDNPVKNVAHYALGTNHVWGLQTESKVGNDGSGLPATDSLIGDPGKSTGIYALNTVDLFNILCIPDATRASSVNASSLDPNVDPNSIFSAAVSMCIDRRAFLIIDAPPNIHTVAAAVDWKSTLLTVQDNSGHGATYFPRLRLPDPNNNYTLRTFAPCGVVAGLYARIDSTRGVWKAPAGIEASLNGVQTLTYKLTDPEHGVLNPLGLNCARTFPVYGTVMWGARTIVGADAEASQWKYVPVRRIASYIEESLYRGTKWVVFEPNDEPLWASIRLNVGTFMQGLFRKGAFQGKTPDEAYFVKCDSQTTTQADIDLGIVNILVGFAPLKPAEFVIIKLSQMSGLTPT